MDRFPIKVAALYAAVAAVWIVGSDQAVRLLFPADVTLVQTAKGWGFVAFTTLLLYVVLRRESNRRNAEAAARRQVEQRLADAQRIAKLGNWEWDVAGDRLWWSEETFRIFGVAEHWFEPNYEAFLGLIHPEDREVVRNALDAVLEGGQRCDIDHRILLRDGTVKVVHEQAEAILDASGKPVRLTGTAHDITERKAATLALLEEKRRAEQYLAIAGTIMVALDAQSRVLLINRKGCEILGWEEKDLLGRDWIDTAIPEAERSAVRAVHSKVMAGELRLVEHHENPVLTRDGEVRIIAWHNAVVRDARGTIMGSLSSGTDVTEQRYFERRLVESENELRTIINNLPDVFFRTDNEGRILMFSPFTVRAFGYSDIEILGMSAARLFVDPAGFKKFRRELDSRGGRVTHYEAQFRRKDGTPLWLSINAFLRQNREGRPVGVEGIGRITTERREIEDKLRFLAGHDRLTDLPNRFEFMERLDQTVARTERNGGLIALLFVDLDGFKGVNDRLGHDCGDLVLQEAARRLTGQIRETDVAGRLGGDEFVVILEGNVDYDAAAMVAEKIVTVMAEPFAVDECEVGISASVGVALYPLDGNDAHALLRNADSAMYLAKKEGRNRYQFWR